jgi:lysophospholipase L1-like esterase
MKYFTILLSVSLLISSTIFSQCSEQEKPKVLLVGDSWAFFMSVDNTINNAFRKWGHSNYKFVSNNIVAENGAKTDDFLISTKQDEIRKLLNQYPSIEVVHISIGGNDVLGEWKVSFTAAKTDSLRQQVAERLLQIFDFIKSCKPGIKILWSGYCYPNFGEVIPTSNLGSNHPFNGTWQKMEYPDFLTINNLLNRFSKDMDSIAKSDPQIEFVNATGLMQYTFGQTQNLGVPPGGSYPPFSVPLPEGNPLYPSPRNSMRDYLLTKDCFHLSPKGYLDLIEYHTQKFYHKFLMDDIYYLPEGNGKSGSVSSNGNISDSLFLGSANGEKFSLLLSFNTTNLPDTALSKASIFLRRESLTGSNPISNSLEVKVKSGNFGTSALVEASDWNDVGDATATPCLFGSNSGNGHWIRLDLPNSMLPFINKNAPTQFIISAPNATNGRVTFSGLNDPDFAPVLNITFYSPPTNIEETFQEKISIYPNPTHHTIQITGNLSDWEKVECYNLLGEKLFEKKAPTSEPIDVSTLHTGIYFLVAKTSNGFVRLKFHKE